MLTCIGKVGQTIVIDDTLFITLLGINENQMLLGFNDPQKICIYRKKINTPSQNPLKTNVAEDVIE